MAVVDVPGKQGISEEPPRFKRLGHVRDRTARGPHHSELAQAVAVPARASRCRGGGAHLRAQNTLRRLLHVSAGRGEWLRACAVEGLAPDLKIAVLTPFGPVG